MSFISINWLLSFLSPQERKNTTLQYLSCSFGFFLAFKLVLLSSCHLFQVIWHSRIRNNWVIFKIVLNCGFLFRCSTADSRLAAYEVLVMLADSSPSNLQLITKELLSMHHQCDPALTKEFDVSLFFICVLVVWSSVIWLTASFIKFPWSSIWNDKEADKLRSIWSKCSESLSIIWIRKKHCLTSNLEMF